jgi:(E)-4-hydroxy-3-methyl-but-2-enyl pyrophosphate reductase
LNHLEPIGAAAFTMKIIVAKTAGFCMGVRRAVDLALDNTARFPGGIKTLGPLIHNRQTVEMLEERGAVELDESNLPPTDVPLLIRAHGIPPEQQQAYTDRGHVIIDGTCPKVKTVHKVIAKYRDQGYDIVITGDEGHAEVVGLQGYAGKQGHLIQSPGDVELLPAMPKVCLVSQTTFDKETFDAIAEALRRRFNASEVVVKKTICSATELRQAEMRQLARQVDSIVVVGGTNSANTKRLASIARECGTPTQLVESEKDIDWPALSRCETIGVAAGASTPVWMISSVVDRLHYLAEHSGHSPMRFVRRTFDVIVHCNVIVASGAAALFYVSCKMQALPFQWTEAIIAFLYFLSMYLWNSLTSIELIQHHGISRYQFYSEHKSALFALSGLSIGAVLIMSFFVNRNIFYLMIFATFAGSVYHFTIVPKPLRRFVRYANLKDIPTSRDIFVALAWAVLLTFLPYADSLSFRMSLAAFICFIWVGFLAFIRSIIFDLRDI